MTARRLAAFLLLTSAALAFAGCTVESNDPSDAGGDAARSDARVTHDAGPPAVCETAGSTLGDACTSIAQCDDGCWCNGTELCLEGTCVAGEAACDDGADCSEDVCDEGADSCAHEPDDTACDDGDACNGTETCMVGRGCRNGPRLLCTDGDACTIGTCDPEEGCTYVERDLDGDGFSDDRCGGADCDDDPVVGAQRNPDADEVCGNGIDDNCNGIVDYRELACTATNDTCATAEMLPGAGTYVRTTRGATSNHPIGCQASGVDTVFRFSLAEARDVEIALAVEGSSGAVAIRRVDGCESGPDAHCGQTSVLARNLAAGDYVAIVRTGTGATFSLTVSFLDATPIRPTDVCNEATYDVSAGGRFTGFFSDVFHDYDLACRSPSSTTTYKDVAYRLVLTEPSDVELTASTQGSSSSSTTYLSLTRDCTAVASSVACVQRTLAEIERRSLAPGVYYVLLESSSTSARTWELDVSVSPAALRDEGDACSSEVDVTNATATLPLGALELDYGTTCGGNTTASRDASFAFTVATTSDVVLTADVGAPHYVAVTTTCGDLTTETSCANGSPRTSQRFLRVEPGTYHVTLATTLASGNVTVSAMLEPPTFPPANDSCTAPQPIAPNVEGSATTLAAADDLVSCGTDGSPDAVHELVLTERTQVLLRARRTDGSGEPISIGIRGTCSASTVDTSCATGAPALLNVTLDAGTYHVVVETPSRDPGAYALVAFLTSP